MEFRQLRYFLAVAETLHFTAAAEKIGIAQPPLSQQIQKLEHEIGTPLFIRNKRHVELTEAGIFFREKAQKIIAETESALAQIKMVAREKAAIYRSVLPVRSSFTVSSHQRCGNSGKYIQMWLSIRKRATVSI
ncbi:LysR family transcriptional regulator [Pectobacteriaceae bacterium C52]|nr:LysR family transcriptional regulator [Pectobacteriaceae bacterium C52]